MSRKGQARNTSKELTFPKGQSKNQTIVNWYVPVVNRYVPIVNFYLSSLFILLNILMYLFVIFP